MVERRSIRSRNDISAEQAVSRNINAIRSLKAAGLNPAAFIIRGTALRGGDVQATARQLLGKPASHPMGPAAPPMSATSRGGVGETIVATANGAIDSLPMGVGNYALAALLTVNDAAHLRNPLASYRVRLAQQDAQDRYDERYHPWARTAGKIAGTAAQLAVPGMALSRLAGGKRIAEAAPLIFKETSKLTGYGALAGAGAQVVDDVLHGRRSSTADYLGSAAGGGAGALTAMYGAPGYVGGVTGAATSLAQDVLNGRVRSLEDGRRAADRAAGAAAVGNLFSVPLGMGAAARVQRLPSFRPKDGSLSKAALGERLSLERSRLRGEEISGVQVRAKVSGGHTVLDHVEQGANRVEAKLGNKARLRPRQKEASREFDDYRVDHLMPNDFGAAAEVPAGTFFYQEYGKDRR